MSATKNSPETGKFYTLNLLSNLSSNYPARSPEDLQGQMEKIHNALESEVISTYTGKWKVVWGPVVKSSIEEPIKGDKRFVADNAMYVAQNQEDLTQYFVGVSGTNAISHAGWFQQDINVKKTRPWPADYLGLPSEEKGKISLGTYKGLKNLWQMEDKLKGSLSHFLTHDVPTDSTIVFGGHSLGGCLCPVLATAVSESMKLSKSVQNLSFNVYPTAGPTPGDEKFASHMANVLDYYQAEFNLNDLVPHAWEFDPSKMKLLKRRYKTFEVGEDEINPEQTIIRNVLNWAASQGERNHYVRKPKPQPQHFKVNNWEKGNAITCKEWVVTAFAFFLSDPIILRNLGVLNENKRLDTETIKNFARFFLEMGAQHIAPYATQFGVPKEVSTAVNGFFYPRGSEMKWKKEQSKVEFRELTRRAASGLAPSYPSNEEGGMETAQSELKQEELEALFGEGGILLF